MNTEIGADFHILTPDDEGVLHRGENKGTIVRTTEKSVFVKYPNHSGTHRALKSTYGHHWCN